MGESKLEEQNALMDSLFTCALVSELQDKMMEVVELRKTTPIITVVEQKYDGKTKKLKLVTTEYKWKEKEWGESMAGDVSVSSIGRGNVHNFYWTLEVSGVFLGSTLRYNSFEECAEAALSWEK